MDNKVYRQGRTIFLSGYIDEQTSGEVINNILFLMADDDKQDKEKKDFVREDINLYIKSGGGNVGDMFGMIDLIDTSKTKINTYAVGYISSAAVPLFISGNKRYIYANTEVMIHACSAGVRGMVQDIMEHTKVVEDTQKMLDKYILSRTKIKKERLDEIREKKFDWYLYADEAVKLGIADEIIA